MKTKYVLIDFENVQPKDLAGLKGHPCKVLVFVGAKQAKVPIELAASLQAMGDGGSYVQISGNGKNALDFHIAFYLGQFAERDPAGDYVVVSKDTGFDPLIAHLRSNGLSARRVPSFKGVTAPTRNGSNATPDKLAMIVANLKRRRGALPRRHSTLANTIDTLFGKRLETAQIGSLIAALETRGEIELNDGRVSYKFEA